MVCVCTPKETDGSSVSLTWGDSSQKYIRARACTANGDTQQVDNDDVFLRRKMKVLLDNRIVNPGGYVTVSIKNYMANFSTWLCYRSGASPNIASPQCQNNGISSTISAEGSGANVLCTGVLSGPKTNLTWSNFTQKYVRFRACNFNGDDQHFNNSLQVVSVLRLKIDITTVQANPGGAISMNISDRDKRTPFWICYTADASSIEVAPRCSQAGNATQIISSGTRCTKEAFYVYRYTHVGQFFYDLPASSCMYNSR